MYVHVYVCARVFCYMGMWNSRCSRETCGEQQDISKTIRCYKTHISSFQFAISTQIHCFTSKVLIWRGTPDSKALQDRTPNSKAQVWHGTPRPYHIGLNIIWSRACNVDASLNRWHLFFVRDRARPLAMKSMSSNVYFFVISMCIWSCQVHMYKYVERWASRLFILYRFYKALRNRYTSQHHVFCCAVAFLQSTGEVARRYQLGGCVLQQQHRSPWDHKCIIVN